MKLKVRVVGVIVMFTSKTTVKVPSDVKVCIVFPPDVVTVPPVEDVETPSLPSVAYAMITTPSPPFPLVTDLPPPPPPPVTRKDPAIALAAKKQREADLRRRGRASTIISGGRGVTGTAPLAQPQARGAQLLGG